MFLLGRPDWVPVLNVPTEIRTGNGEWAIFAAAASVQSDKGPGRPVEHVTCCLTCGRLEWWDYTIV